MFAMVGLIATGCRGDHSAKPPIHLIDNMDQQHRVDPQEANPFFKDKSGMRVQVAGTVAQGELEADDHLYRGRVDNNFADTLPFALNRRLLERGQSRYNIYCAPCHDRAGTGNGIIASYGMKQGMAVLPDFADPRLRAMPIGQIYDVIRQGVRSMPAYGPQIPVRDRWLIAAYVRTLQLSRAASLQDVPPDLAEQMGFSSTASEIAPKTSEVVEQP